MEKEKRDYRKELNAIQIEKEEVQSRYAGLRRELEDRNEELVYRIGKESSELDDPNINRESELVSIYEERLSLFRRHKNEQEEYYDVLEQQERGTLQKLSDKERDIKVEMNKDNENKN